MLSAEQKLLDNGYEDVVIFDGDTYDEALIGVSEDGMAIYDYETMIDCLMVKDGMT